MISSIWCRSWQLVSSGPSRYLPQAVSAHLMSMKNSNDTTGNRIRDLPVCSAVPQRTAPPRAPSVKVHSEFSFTYYYLLFMDWYRKLDLISEIRNGRLRWIGDLTRNPEERSVKKVFKNKHLRKKTVCLRAQKETDGRC